MKSKYVVKVYANGYFVNTIHGDRLTGCLDFDGNPVVALWAGATLVTTFGSMSGRTESLRVASVKETGSCFITVLEHSIVNDF